MQYYTKYTLQVSALPKYCMGNYDVIYEIIQGNSGAITAQKLHVVLSPVYTRPLILKCFGSQLASYKCTKPLYKSLSKSVCKPRLGGGLKSVSNGFRIYCYTNCPCVNALSWLN
jgi:hypothetical protein